MNKHEYVELHRLLAKLRYLLAIAICETNDEELIKEYQGNIKAIEDIMKVFIMEE